MRKVIIAVIATGFISIQSCTSPPVQEHTKAVAENGLILKDFDTSVRPQDDFYNYVNGNWMKTAKIPSDKTSWGSLDKLAELTDSNSISLLNSLLSEKFAPNSEGQKIQDLYGSYMDTTKRDAEGINPIKGDLAKINAIQNLADFQKYIDEATAKGDNPFYGWIVGADLKNSKMNTVYLGVATLGLGRDYYQKTSPRNTEVLVEYTKYVSKILSKVGYKNASITAKKIVDFEKNVAQSLLTNEKVHDSNLHYNPKTLAELSTLVKNVNLPDYLKSVGVDTNKIIVSELKYYQSLDGFIKTENLPLLKDYMKFHLVSGHAQYLNTALGNAKFDFYSKYLTGQKERRTLKNRGYQLINVVLGEALGKLYVEKYFPAEAKTEMEEMIGYLKKSFANHINNLKWMSGTTKEKALEKLNKFTAKVAYPDKWKDYSKLDIKSEANGGSLYSNLANVAVCQNTKNLAMIGKPVDKSEWIMAPQTVNAYYNPANNEIVFPAAFLQPPFFNFKADPAINFGGIGAVIGHEITHGFDDLGAQFDGDGNLKDWWTPTDKANFIKVTKALASQYSAYEPVEADYIFVSHGHIDHVADLVTIAKQTNATVAATPEITGWIQPQGIKNIHPMNFGSYTFDFGKVRMVSALHSSSLPDGSYAGNPAGFVLKLEGKQIYFAGDTGLTLEMKILADLYKLDYAILPIGGNYTLDIEDALIATRYVNCDRVIGVHYNTSPTIKIDTKEAIDKFKRENKTLLLPSIGETISL